MSISWERRASPDLPVTPGVVGPPYSGGPQLMIIKLNPTCDTILAWTYLGTDGDDQTWENSGIALDSSGNVYIAGQTRNATATLFGIQPNQSGNWDGIVAKLSGDLTTLHYATYLGGTGLDRIHDIAVNASGEVFVVGQTRSTDFPTTGGVLGATTQRSRGALRCLCIQDQQRRHRVDLLHLCWRKRP